MSQHHMHQRVQGLQNGKYALSQVHSQMCFV